ncbi:LPXTG cell wall anchor domain-containing protein [Micromonospora sp. RHAY321]|uniref:LPXTG cell wall anchor domain-containing protein n=1 Tax=Micromonospora sp. RHAY321 TaxID=2944807 RepID=UPI00207CB37B|nr:LPXTG cell wall anchor domain-containing protein [Micromonospora sp. RHAY321]MCO1596559.1 LPXTG cell wall anchor domain-containing protein [Micromonospora sp. RHAY321]
MRAALVKLVATGVAAGAFLTGAASAAQAQPTQPPPPSTIDINPGNVPTTAAAFTQNCDPNLGGGPFPNQDVWVFNLPGNPQTSGQFLTVTGTWSIPNNGTVSRTIPVDGGAIVNDMGTSKAWIRLPAGWTLTDASAVITGEAGFFVLTQTCAASGQPTTPPPTTQPPTSAPPTTTAPPTATPTKSELPITGTSAGSLLPMAIFGLGAVALGAAFIAVRRRRDAEG